MKYKVTYRKRFSADGEPADDPKSLVDPGDGVIEDRNSSRWWSPRASELPRI